MIRCVDVHKSYAAPGAAGGARVDALRGVNLSLGGAGFSAIMGASGSGKSTLLHLLAALDTPDRGEIEIGGVRVDRLGERDLTRFRGREIGVVFQQFNLLPTMTAAENVELPGILAGQPAGASRKRALEVLDALGMSPRAGHRPEALSGGEQQRVAIARALANRPRIVLADEPTGNLDPVTASYVFDALEALVRQSGLAALIATHNHELAGRMDRRVTLNEGKVVPL